MAFRGRSSDEEQVARNPSWPGTFGFHSEVGDIGADRYLRREGTHLAGAGADQIYVVGQVQPRIGGLAELNYLEGKPIYHTEARHTHLEWLQFLKHVDREVPKALQVQIIADIYSTQLAQAR